MQLVDGWIDGLMDGMPRENELPLCRYLNVVRTLKHKVVRRTGRSFTTGNIRNAYKSFVGQASEDIPGK
jgi:hypothetical protein